MSTELLRLFNHELVDFVKQLPDGTYQPAWPKHATHELVPTRWNRGNGDVRTPDIFALSVCAVPLRRGKRPKPSFPIERPLPKRHIAYRCDATEAGKRAALTAILKRVRAPDEVIAWLPECDGPTLDAIYHDVLRASILLRNGRHRGRRRQCAARTGTEA